MNIILLLDRLQEKSSAIAPVLKRLRQKTVLAGVIVLTTVGLSACSFNFSVGGLDMGELEEQITTGIEEQTGNKLESIDCPKNRDIKEGDVFACTATTEDGSTITITVAQTDDQGNVNWEVVDADDSKEAAEEPIASNAGSDEDTDQDVGEDNDVDAPISNSPADSPTQTANNSAATLNTSKLVKAISLGITEQTGLVVESVDCPDRPISDGDVFNCTANGQKNSTMTIEVVQQDDLGNINWEITSSTRIIDLDVMEQQIVEQLTDQSGVSGVVECGDDRYKVAGAGETFECTGTDNNGNEGIIKVTVQNDDGNYLWEIN